VVATPGTLPPSRTVKDYLALAIATCGVGYFPLAPGTCGSLVGVGVYLLWQMLRLRFYLAYGDGHWTPLWVYASWTALTLVGVLSLTMIGIWAASRVEQLSGRKDPGIVVIDEVAGQLIALVFIPYFLWQDWPLLVAGFLLFRLFDIWKPYPIRRLEALKSGLGIMADDVLAGFYAAAVLAVLVVFRAFLLS
jgi:phosphatidylglycerophosphatase A